MLSENMSNNMFTLKAKNTKINNKIKTNDLNPCYHYQTMKTFINKSWVPWKLMLDKSKKIGKEGNC